MRRVRALLATAVFAAAVAAPTALAQEAPSTASSPAPTTPAPSSAPSPAPAPAPAPATPGSTIGPVQQGGTITAPSPGGSSGTNGGGSGPVPAPSEPAPSEEPPPGTTEPIETTAPPEPSSDSYFAVPPTPTAICGGTGPPTELLPIYQAASDRYALGPRGPAVLAAINKIETNFGELNDVTSYAGAIGWMQFMPATWAAYGVDADGDGEADPYNPRDAIFSAANYLSASGFPEDVYGAIYAYNHADWYVAEVLADAGCYGQFSTPEAVVPQLPVIDCNSKMRGPDRIPVAYLQAFEDAAGRYSLGEQGVWALAAVARLESDYGRNMSERQMKRSGPLGLDEIEWRRFGVDGNDDSRVQRFVPADSAATLARMIWSRGDLEAGVFSHNQAKWYVDAVLAESAQMKGSCKITYAKWPIRFPDASPAQINFDNLEFLNPSVQLPDIQNGLMDERIMALLATLTQNHTITLSSTRSDHSMLTAGGSISNHYYGRAIDIAAVDGVSCTDTAPTAPCGELARMMTLLPADLHPTELIYCYDVDGPGPAFALADHCDHIHAGFEG